MENGKCKTGTGFLIKLVNYEAIKGIPVDILIWFFRSHSEIIKSSENPWTPIWLSLIIYGGVRLVSLGWKWDKAQINAASC